MTRRLGLFGLALLVLGASYGYGLLSHRNELPPAPQLRGLARWAQGLVGADNTGRQDQGKWFPAESAAVGSGQGEADAGAELSEEERARLVAIGYLDGYEPSGDRTRVTVFHEELSAPGLNLYNSGHGPEAYLMHMDGRVAHQWRYSFADAFPEYPSHLLERSRQWWRRVHLLPNGDLLAIFEGLGLIRIDKDSNLLWARAGGYHHDVHVGEDGQLYVLWREARIIPHLHETEPMLEDFIEIMSPEGETLRRVSVLEALERSDYAPLLRRRREHGDILHTNTIEMLDNASSDLPAFVAGRALISIRRLDAVALVDLEREEVVWAMSGLFAEQHESTLLENGNVLLFDNTGHASGSRVLEIDPVTKEVVWSYDGSAANGFYSNTLGSCQRLSNGNTLITESEAGRAFEVTPNLEIVWEFYNPERAGSDHELIATLFEVVRLESDFAPLWLEHQDAIEEPPRETP